MSLFGRSAEKAQKKKRSARVHTSEASGSAGDTEERFGLFELWPDTPPGEASRVSTVIDIVAVHGLGGHPYKTWTEGGKLWLRDFLPKAVPEARVLTFGYDSRIAFGGTASRIDEYARTLLERLLQKRRPYKDTVRPVIFVCHSLGGIVFKRALVMAHAHSSRYGSLIAAIKSVIFLGTPHRGSNIAKWSKILGRLANVSKLGGIRTDLLKDLQPKSELLMTIASDFIERGAGLTIFSIYERKLIPGLPSLIVDKDSAILNQQNETPLPIEADHRTMCKFLTSSSEAYALVFDCLSELIDAAKGEDDSWLSKTQADFMRSLGQFDHWNVFRQIPCPIEGTCKWIAQDPEFRRWRTPSRSLESSENCRVFYVYGPPGVGKTVMSRFVLTYLRQTLEMNNLQRHIVVHFFCDDKDLKRRTSLNLLRSLLLQILMDDKQLLRYISTDAMTSFLQALGGDSVEPDELDIQWDALLAIIQRSRAIQFWFIIDAIDELEPASRKDVAHQLNRILDIDAVGRLKLFFTNRQAPEYQYSDQATLELGASESEADVRIYIRQSVVNFSNEIRIEPKLKAAIEDEIVMMACGSFLHASLAFANFSRGVTDWTPRVIKNRLKDLQKLPASLEAFYAGLLRQIPADFRQKARRAFIWVLGSISRSPLTLKELHYAVSVNDDQHAWSDLEEDLGYNFESSFQEACGYLLRVDSDGFVAFSHQTVKELFESTKISAREIDEEVLRIYRIAPKDIDVEIVQTCITILQFRDFDRNHVARSLMSESDLYLDLYDNVKDPLFERSKSFPLLSYALMYWGRFGDDSYECHVVERLQSFFQSFQGNYFRLAAGPWSLDLRKAVPGATGLLPLELPSLHHCAQMGDFPKAIHALVASGANVNELDADGMSPLHWACARGNKAAVVALLEIPQLDPNAGLPGKNRPAHTALDWLNWYSSEDQSYMDVALLVLKDPRCDVNLAGSSSRTPLHICLHHKASRHRAISEYLLDHTHIDINAKDEDGHTPFYEAVNQPENEYVFMKMLKNPNVRLDTTTKAYYANGLSMAGWWGWREVEAALIGINVDEVFVIGNDGFNYLTRLAFHGRKQAVLRVLDLLMNQGERLRESVGEGAKARDGPPAVRDPSREYRMHPTVLNRMLPGSDINDEYRIFHHLLHLCAQQDWEDVANILEERFDIHGLPGGDHVGRTMLHWAVENSWEYAMRDLSHRPKPWIDIQDRDGMTALHIACIHQNHQVAKHLVDSGASYLLKDKLGRNPVHVAAEFGCRSIIRLFIDETTREYGRDNQGRSLLHFLVMWQSGSLIEDFIKTKSPIIDVLDKKRRTPLSYASLYNNNEALEVLLHHGAKVNSLDSNGSIPLHQALKGSATTASLLIGWNAKLKSLDGFYQTCLQIAIRSQRKDTIELIFSHIGNWKHRLDERGWQIGHSSTVRMIRNKDFHGKTALHRICAAHDYSGKHITKQDVFDLVLALIDHGAEVNAQDNFGYTPAHMAAIGNNMAAMDALLDENPDLALLDQHECTAMDWALAQGQLDMADMMREAGGVTTRDYADKLGAYHSSQPKQVQQKQYDMTLWSLVKGETKEEEEFYGRSVPGRRRRRRKNLPL